MTPRTVIEPARLAGTALLRTQSDARLVDLVRGGNDRAFEAIVHRYRRPLLNYCERFLTPARAEDAVQQSFVNAFAAIRSGEAEINLRPWLYRIAHNASLNVLRQPGSNHEPISEQIDGVETPPQAFERGERLRSVVSSLKQLPERQRDALVLQALEGRSYEEIAGELGVSGGAVRQLLNRARVTLREGATALTPVAFVTRLGGTLEAPVAERIGQVVTGAGGGAALAKGMAVVVAAGAVVGGTVDTVLPGGHHRARPDAPVAASLAPGSTGEPRHSPAAGSRRVTVALKRSHASGGHSGGHAGAHRGSGGGGGERHGSGTGETRHESGSRDSGGSHDGERSHSGSDDGERSGSDTVRTEDHSGSGSDDGTSSGSTSSGSDDGLSVDNSGSGSFSSGSDDGASTIDGSSGSGSGSDSELDRSSSDSGSG